MINEEEKLPFTSHLEELRTRLIRVFIAVGVGLMMAKMNVHAKKSIVSNEISNEVTALTNEIRAILSVILVSLPVCLSTLSLAY